MPSPVDLEARVRVGLKAGPEERPAGTGTAPAPGTAAEVPDGAPLFSEHAPAATYRQLSPTLAAGPIGAFFQVKREDGARPRITAGELDRVLDQRLGSLPEDAQVLVFGVEVSRLERSRHRARVRTLQDGDLSELLLAQPGRRVLVLAPASFSEAFTESPAGALTLSLEALELGRTPAFAVRRPSAPRAMTEPVFVETYSELPRLLSAYVQEMERLKLRLELFQESRRSPAQAGLQAQLLGELGALLDELEQRRPLLPGLPDMSLLDLKLNLASLFARARREHQRREPPDRARARLDALHASLEERGPLRLPVDGLPPALAARVDQNNLALSAIETEARLGIIDDLTAVMLPHADGVNVLGSAAWGAYSEVNAASDVDLEVMLPERALADFAQSLAGVDPASLEPAQALALLEGGRGPVYALLRGLHQRGYAAGDDEGERARALLHQLGTFAALHQSPPLPRGPEPEIELRKGHRGAERPGGRAADYLAYKVVTQGVELSIHFFPTETYVRACELDLLREPHTRLLTELRVGQRKQSRASKPELILADTAIYPQKRSFDGAELGFSCDVRAVVRQGSALSLVRPSKLEDRHLLPGALLGWATETPAVVFEGGRLYHGLFQDKLLWGRLAPGTGEALVQAKQRMVGALVRRFAEEVRLGTITAQGSSLSRLSARHSRIPPSTQRQFLLALRDQCPEQFRLFRSTLERLGSDELRRLGIVDRSSDPADLGISEGHRARAELAAADPLATAAQMQRLEAPPRIAAPSAGAQAEIVFLVKPLGMEAGVEPKVRAFIEAQGGTIAGEWRGIADARRIAEHYQRHADKPVFGDLVSYFSGKEVAVYRVRLPAERIAEVRQQLGSYKPAQGSLREELVGGRWLPLFQRTGLVDNGLHISDSAAEGEREALVWFEPPPIVSDRPQTVAAHQRLYAALSRIDPNLQFAGSQLTGLAIDGKVDDLDYRLLADDVDRMASQVGRVPGVSFRREGVDHKSGQRFLLFEAKWEGGKADIAVVPKEAFRHRVSAAVLAKYLPEEWKAEVRAIKERWRGPMEQAIAEHGHGSPEYRSTKADYEREKKSLYRTVKRYFGLSQKSGELPPLAARPVPAGALSARLAQLDAREPGLGAQLQAVIELLPDASKGVVLEQVLAFEAPDPPAELAPAIARAARDAEDENTRLVERHRPAFERYRAPFPPLKEQLDAVVRAVAAEAGGTAVLTAIKGERRGVARAVLKGSAEEPNFFQIKDMVRASVVVPTVAAAGRAIDSAARKLGGRIMVELDKSGYLVKVPKNRFQRPVGGYYDYMLKADFGGGRQGEIQFHLPEMLLAKFLGRGHETYDRMRHLARLFDHPQHGEAARRYYQRLDVATRDFYGAVMELARARVGQEGFLELHTPYVDAKVDAVRSARREGRQP